MTLGAETTVEPAHASLAKTGCILLAAGIAGALLVLPYVLELEADALHAAVLKSGLRLTTVLAVSMLQTSILLAIAVFAGLWAARKLGLGAPLLDALLRGERIGRPALRALSAAAGIGLLAGAVIVFLDQRVFPPLHAHTSAAPVAEPAAWKGFLASFYGAIDEELLFRLGLLSLLALALERLAALFRGARKELGAVVFWSANFATAIAFGLGHLPATAAVATVTPIVVARAVVLNGIAGVACGWLYWRRGLEAAMVGHFTADLVLHVAVPLAR